MTASVYAFREVITAQCPKCNGTVELPLCREAAHQLEYAVVCESASGDGARCGTTLRLRVVSHEFPAQVGRVG